MTAKQKKKAILKKPAVKQGKPVIEKKSTFTIPQWAVIAVLIFTALLYVRALSNGFANLDDDDYISKNPFIRDFSLHGIKAIFSSVYFGMYHPLTTLTYLFEYTLFGLHPLPYHLFNIILHLLNTWIVFKLVEQISGNKITSLIVTILFAIHPMHVESVAWIAERKDMMYTLFYLLSLLVYMRYLKQGYKPKLYIGALLLFVASLLSKPAAVTLPVLLIAIDIYKRRKLNIKSLIDKIPFFALSLLFGIIALLQQNGEALNDLSLPYNFVDRIFLFTYTIAFYIIKFVIPFNLSAMHYYPNTHGGPLPWEYFASLPFLLLIGWLVIKLKSFKKETVFGFAFFLIAISIMLQIIPNCTALTCERYSYVSYIGLFFIVGNWIANIQKKQSKQLAVILFTVVALVFSVQSWVRLSVWKNGEVLITDVINKNPDYYNGYWLRAIIKRNNGDLKAALLDFDKAVECRPNFATGLVDRGAVRDKVKDFKGALDDMNSAIGLGSTLPEIYVNRGMAYEGLGKPDLAMLDYNKAIQMKPDMATAYNNRSVIKANAGDTKGAMNDINTAIRLDPDNAEEYRNRGSIKNFEKNYQGSLEDFNYALKLKPNDSIACFNRGVTKLNLADTAGACEDWKKALKFGYIEASGAIQKICH